MILNQIKFAITTDVNYVLSWQIQWNLQVNDFLILLGINQY